MPQKSKKARKFARLHPRKADGTFRKTKTRKKSKTKRKK